MPFFTAACTTTSRPLLHLRQRYFATGVEEDRCRLSCPGITSVSWNHFSAMPSVLSGLILRTGAAKNITAGRIVHRGGQLSESRRTMAQASRRIYVKGDPEAGILGDCPFCHRALLTLEIKGLEYDKMYVDFAAKPEDLFVDNPDGKVPVLLDGDVRVPDSGAIVEYLEEKYTDAPKLGESTIQGVGEKVFPSFVQFLKSGQEEQEEKEAALLEQLQQVDDYLAANGPYLSGAEMGAADSMTLPRLYHMSVALPHFKKWSVPEKFSALNEYMKLAQEHPAFKATDYGPDMIIKGWLGHGLSPP